MKKKIGVIGIGNPLRRDDGIGIVLLERLQKRKKKLPGVIEYIDGGTGGLNLLYVLSRYNTILIIDAVDFHGIPGESRMVSLEEIRSLQKPVSLSTHQSDFLNVIRLSKELHEFPYKVYIFAVQPKDVSFGSMLSAEIAQVIDTLTVALQNKIQEIVK
jgi:hydrogenase maturation protease